jgi:hypothetical protein
VFSYSQLWNDLVTNKEELASIVNQENANFSDQKNYGYRHFMLMETTLALEWLTL